MREKPGRKEGRIFRVRWQACLASLACLAAVSLGAVGCGYQFRVEGAGPTIGGAAHDVSQGPAPRIVIRTLLNRSFEPNLETRYTNYLRHEFAAGSGAKVVSDFDAHDFVLTGEILSVGAPTLSFNQTATLESRAEAVVRVSVEDAKTKKIVWSQLARGASEFYVTRDLQFNRALQNRALEQAGRLAAADLAAWFLLQLESGTLSTQTDTPSSGTP
ncbi:MAG: LPS assembly lipoprotein LptE [Nitrospira sp.]|nr:LPS assembly lipoprotein LptE [Nitrospira sp.]